jgi:hypothetical protein
MPDFAKFTTLRKAGSCRNLQVQGTIENGTCAGFAPLKAKHSAAFPPVLPKFQWLGKLHTEAQRS